MEWALDGEPNSAGPNSITMTAALATDDLPGAVAYYFECVSGDGNDSDWTTSRTYVDTGLIAGNEYGYTVRARDISLNETVASSIGYATPDIVLAPTPSVPDINDAQQLAQSAGSGKYNWYHRLIVTALPDDLTGRPLYYNFVDTSYGVFSSGWSVAPVAAGGAVTYDALVKLNSYTGQECTWRLDVSFNADGSNSSSSSTVTIYEMQNDGFY